MQLITPTPLYFDDAITEQQPPIVLNRERLLEGLRALMDSRAMPDLRRSVGELRAEIENTAGQLRAKAVGTDSVSFAPEYLASELAQIASSYTTERAHYYVQRFIKSITEVRTGAINDINLNRWKEYEDIYTDSLWLVNRRDGSGAHTAGYWGNFIPQIPYQMMRRYTRLGDWVIDPFAGSGTTLIEARRLGRNCLGIELQASVAERAREQIAAEPDEHGTVAQVVASDCLDIDYRYLLRQHGRASAQLAILHPPYYDIIKFSDDPRDLSNAASIGAFLALLGGLVDRLAPILDAVRYLALVFVDTYGYVEWIPLGFHAMNEVLRRDFALKSIIVKNFEDTTGKRQQKELWKYRALVGGFYIFKHEYIFVFRKR
jgi:hypothetical protein